MKKKLLFTLPLLSLCALQAAVGTDSGLPKKETTKDKTESVLSPEVETLIKESKKILPDDTSSTPKATSSDKTKVHQEGVLSPEVEGLLHLITPALELKDGTVIKLDKNKLPKTFKGKLVPGNKDKARRAERYPSYVTPPISFSDKEGNVTASFRLVKRSNIDALYKSKAWSNKPIDYVKAELVVTAKKAPVEIKRVIFFNDVGVKDAKVSGYTDGSVLEGKGWYAGIEHPMAQVGITGGKKEDLDKWTPQNVATGKQTWLVEPKAGDSLKMSFNYTSGSHALQIIGVKLLSGDKILAQDIHAGSTGDKSTDNTYTLKVPAQAKGKLELVAEYKNTNETNSFGSITLEGAELLPAPPTISGSLPRSYVLNKGDKWAFSAVLGAAPEGQERRAFLNYLENERAKPYHLFVHYNSWYHLCISSNNNQDPLKRLTEENTLKAMKDMSDALYKKRGVFIQSYLWDDGWDDWNSLWNYHKGFPQGFTPLAKEAKAQKSGISAWLSPWGGYGHSKGKRVEYGQSQGLETIDGGYSLRAPKYFDAFKNRCLQMIKDYDMNMFKFDGIGAGTWASGAPLRIAPDLEGMMKLIGELRKAKPDVFINCTVGTWASPFWVLYADSIWRQGDDCDYKGVGNKREQWITYRDGTVYKRFAKDAPLFPLNSIMNHGVIVGEHSVPAPMPRGDSPEAIMSYGNEMWTMAGSGTNLQELYISPHLMTEKWWDITADAIKWARSVEDSLIDTHWVGGDPEQLQVYGYASWSPEKGSLTLRNPSDSAQVFEGCVAEWLNIPASGKKKMKAKTVYSSHGKTDKLPASSEEKVSFSLEPFEVKVLEFDFSK